MSISLKKENAKYLHIVEPFVRHSPTSLINSSMNYKNSLN